MGIKDSTDLLFLSCVRSVQADLVSLGVPPHIAAASIQAVRSYAVAAERFRITNSINNAGSVIKDEIREELLRGD